MNMVNDSNVHDEGSTNAITSAMPTVVPILDHLADDEARNTQETLHLEDSPSANFAAANANNMGQSPDVQNDNQEINKMGHGNVACTVQQAPGAYLSYKSIVFTMGHLQSFKCSNTPCKEIYLFYMFCVTEADLNAEKGSTSMVYPQRVGDEQYQGIEGIGKC